MNNDFDSLEMDSLEHRLRASAATLPPELRHRVLEQCAIKAREKACRNRRANWRLAWGFAVLCALNFGVGGMLDAQRQAMLGNSSSSTPLYADAASQNDFRQSVLLRSQLLAELSNPRHDFS